MRDYVLIISFSYSRVGWNSWPSRFVEEFGSRSDMKNLSGTGSRDFMRKFSSYLSSLTLVPRSFQGVGRRCHERSISQRRKEFLSLYKYRRPLKSLESLFLLLILSTCRTYDTIILIPCVNILVLHSFEKKKKKKRKNNSMYSF